VKCCWPAALATVALCSACSSGEPPGTSTPPITTSAPSTTTSPSAAGFPRALVGAWSSSGDTTEIAYRFLADGRYRSAEMISQPVPGGLFEFSVVHDGRAEVRADRLLLSPSRATGTRHHPSSPQEDYTDRALPLEQRVFVWSLTGTTLHLRDEAGLELVLVVQHE
jgi:hypothetical protein